MIRSVSILFVFTLCSNKVFTIPFQQSTKILSSIKQQALRSLTEIAPVPIIFIFIHKSPLQYYFLLNPSLIFLFISSLNSAELNIPLNKSLVASPIIEYIAELDNSFSLFNISCSF